MPKLKPRKRWWNWSRSREEKLKVPGFGPPEVPGEARALPPCPPCWTALLVVGPPLPRAPFVLPLPPPLWPWPRSLMQ
jgi:hypothetical protein